MSLIIEIKLQYKTFLKFSDRWDYNEMVTNDGFLTDSNFSNVGLSIAALTEQIKRIVVEK